jgi:tetratricopeptide (TPR) repeat protein
MTWATGPVAWAPDGTRLATTGPGDGNGQALLWDARTGQPAGPPLRMEGKEPIGAMTFSADGRRLLTVTGFEDSTRGQARVWDATTGTPVSPVIPLPSNAWSGQVQLDPRGERLALQGADSLQRSTLVQLLDVATGRAAAPPWPHEQVVSHVQFSPDGRRVLTLSGDGVVRLWDPTTGELLRMLKQEQRIAESRFSDDGRRVLTYTPLGITTLAHVQVWDTTTGQPLSPPFLATTRSVGRGGVGPGTTGPNGLPVRSAAMSTPSSRDADRLLIRGIDGLTVYDLAADERPAAELRALAQLLSGRHVNAAGTIQALPAEAYEESWRQARARFAADWGAAPVEGLAWHRREAGEDLASVSERISTRLSATAPAYARLWHLERLLAAEPDNVSHLAARGRAYYDLRDDARAVADLTRAIDRGQHDDLRQTRANALARLGRWKEAEADFTWVNQNTPPVRSTTGGPPPRFTFAPRASLAMLRLQLGDAAGYREVRHALLEDVKAIAERAQTRVRNTSSGVSPGFISPFVWPLLLSGETADDLQNLLPPEEELPLTSSGSSPTSRGGYSPSGRFTRWPFDVRGALEYRLGHYAKADKRLKAVLEDNTDPRPGNYFFLAMAQAKAGRRDEARKSLARGVELLKETDPDDEQEPESLLSFVYGSGWQQRLAEQLLRREAQQAVDGGKQ